MRLARRIAQLKIPVSCWGCKEQNDKAEHECGFELDHPVKHQREIQHEQEGKREAEKSREPEEDRGDIFCEDGNEKAEDDEVMQPENDLIKNRKFASFPRNDQIP
jgi:hypothetical protein